MRETFNLIRLILILAVLVLALSFFGISIRSIVQSPAGKDNFTFIWELLKTGWQVLSGWIGALIEAGKNLPPPSPSGAGQ